MIRNTIVPTIQGGRMYQFTITALQILYFAGSENTLVWAFKNAYSVEDLSSETPNEIEGLLVMFFIIVSKRVSCAHVVAL